MIEIKLRFGFFGLEFSLPPPGVLVFSPGRSMARRADIPDPSKSSTTSFPSAFAVLRLFSIRRNADPGEEDVDDDEDEVAVEEEEGCMNVVGEFEMISKGHTNVMTSSRALMEGL